MDVAHAVFVFMSGTVRINAKVDVQAIRSFVNVCSAKVSAMVVINAMFADKVNAITMPIPHINRIDSNSQIHGRG